MASPGKIPPQCVAGSSSSTGTPYTTEQLGSLKAAVAVILGYF